MAQPTSECTAEEATIWTLPAVGILLVLIVAQSLATLLIHGVALVLPWPPAADRLRES